MKRIHLEDRFSPMTISDTTYAKLLAIIEGGRVCKQCEQPYGPLNPMVTRNTCKTCFLEGAKPLYLSYIGVSAGSNLRGDVTHLFMDKRGMVYTTQSEGDIYHLSERKRIPETLRLWGFPFPETYTTTTGTYTFYGPYWTLYGDITRNRAMVIQYAQDSYESLFLSYKGRDYHELGKDHAIFTRAYAQAEAAKDQAGIYHLFGNACSDLFDDDIFRLIAAIASEEL